MTENDGIFTETFSSGELNEGFIQCIPQTALHLSEENGDKREAKHGGGEEKQ